MHKIKHQLLSRSTTIYSYLSYSTGFLFIFSYLVLSSPEAIYFLLDPDQGNWLSMAQEILQGIHPFINIKTISTYGPLASYGSAFGQYLSVNRLIGEVSIIILGYTLAYMLLFSLTRQLTKSNFFSLILLIFLVFLMPRFYKYYIVMGPALTIAALNIYLHSHKSVWVVALGFAVSITGMYRFDFGFYAFITSILAIILKQKNKGAICKDFCGLTLAGLIFTSPWLIFLKLKTHLTDVMVNIISDSTKLASGLALPAPTFNFGNVISRYNYFSFQFWFFLSIPLIAIVVIIFRRSVFEKRERNFVLCISFFSFIIFTQALHRSDYGHFLQVIPISLIIAGWMIKVIWIVFLSNRLYFTKIFSSFALALFLLLGYSFFPFFHYTNPISIKRKFDHLSDKFHHYLLSRSQLRDYYRNSVKNRWAIDVVDYVHNNTSENDYVLFLPYSPQFYYFSERLYSTPIGHFHPGSFPTHKAQVEFINEMTNTSLVVDLPEFSYDQMPERNAKYYAPEIMKYIYQNYRIVERFGPANILFKKNIRR